MRRYRLGVRGREFVIDVQELAADRFEVVVGDEHYEVTLSGDEFLPEATITPGYEPAAARGDVPVRPAAAGPAVAAPRSAPAAAPAQPKPPARPVGGGGGAGINAPMPGVILEVHVKTGDVVQRGQPVAVLDAMKMHNTIGAPRAGTIGEVCVAPGQAVGHGDAIVRFAEG
jgi:glutaconyl-CoA/methylmalonyl-CoA decarboxylase subunit gamma